MKFTLRLLLALGFCANAMAVPVTYTISGNAWGDYFDGTNPADPFEATFSNQSIRFILEGDTDNLRTFEQYGADNRYKETFVTQQFLSRVAVEQNFFPNPIPSTLEASVPGNFGIVSYLNELNVYPYSNSSYVSICPYYVNPQSCQANAALSFSDGPPYYFVDLKKPNYDETFNSVGDPVSIDLYTTMGTRIFINRWENLSFTVAVSAVPEPSTYLMLLAGLGLIIFARQRHQSPRAVFA